MIDFEIKQKGNNIKIKCQYPILHTISIDLEVEAIRDMSGFITGVCELVTHLKLYPKNIEIQAPKYFSVNTPKLHLDKPFVLVLFFIQEPKNKVCGKFATYVRELLKRYV